MANDPTAAIRLKAGSYPGVDAGTACTQSSFKVGKKSFLFVGPQGGRFKAMFKLDKSMPEAVALANKEPDRYGAGSTGWVTARFSADQPMPKKIWAKWLEESYALATKPKSTSKKAPVKKARSGVASVMAELKKNGSAQTRKTYRNLGVQGDLFGVSYAFLKKLNKRVKVDHELALALWETNNLDARIFACWTADAKKTTIKLLDTWAREQSEPILAGELAAFAQDTDLAAGRMRKWMRMKSAYHQRLGWCIAGSLVMQPSRGPDEGGVDESDVAELLERIERDLQASPNNVRHVMNNALIAIGCRPRWMRKAIAVARKIGKVEVDFGDRSCKVNDAATNIRKTVDHYKKQGKSPTDGTAGKRRRHC